MDMRIREEHLSGNTLLDLQHINIFISAMKIATMTHCVTEETDSFAIIPLQTEMNVLLGMLEEHIDYEEYLMTKICLDDVFVREQKRTHSMTLDELKRLEKSVTSDTVKQVHKLMCSIYDHINNSHELAFIIAVKKDRKLRR